MPHEVVAIAAEVLGNGLMTTQCIGGEAIINGQWLLARCGIGIGASVQGGTRPMFINDVLKTEVHIDAMARQTSRWMDILRNFVIGRDDGRDVGFDRWGGGGCLVHPRLNVASGIENFGALATPNPAV